MRIVSGLARGIRLAVPEDGGVRPTEDKVKESLFSTLGDLRGARILDLFSGTGALGLEALQVRYTPEEVVGKLAFLAGLNPDAAPCRPEELLADFDWRRVPLEDVRLPENLF